MTHNDSKSHPNGSTENVDAKDEEKYEQKNGISIESRYSDSSRDAHRGKVSLRSEEDKDDHYLSRGDEHHSNDEAADVRATSFKEKDSNGKTESHDTPYDDVITQQEQKSAKRITTKEVNKPENKEPDEDEVAEEEEEEDDDDDDEEPPLLKYSRVTQLPRSFFTRDSISACQFHDKVFAFATHAGLLHFTEPDFTTIRTFKCHRSSITSVYTDGELFATSSIDGTVVIGSVRDSSDLLACDFKRPVHAVVLDEKYKTSKTFVSGGMAGDVILSQRNWLGNRVDITIDKNNGPIVGIYTVDDVLFWMNDAGITFYSISSRNMLLQVPFPRDEHNTRPDLHWPSVHFPETDRIIIAWGKHIWTFKISLAKSTTYGNHLGSILSSAASSLRAIPDKKIEQDHYLYLSLTLAGAVFFRNDQLLCLEVPVSKSLKNKSDHPQLKVIDMLTGEEIHGDEVVSKNYQNLNSNDYHLGKHIGKDSTDYYMISSSDAISAHELSLKDRYEWFVNNDKFYEAWKIGLYAVDKRERLEMGMRHVKKLLSAQDNEECASAITDVFSNTDLSEEDPDFERTVVNKWGEFISIMVKNGKVNEIAPLIPVQPPLPSDVYDSILSYYLENNLLSLFSHYSHQWPRNLWNSNKFQDILEEIIERNEVGSNEYRQELVFLLLTENKEVKAIPHLIKMKDPRALDIILSERVLPMFSNQILEITLLPYHGTVKSLPSLSLGDATMIFKKSIEVLVQGAHMIDMSLIISQLSSFKEVEILLFLFLREASKAEPILIAPYENDMVQLYFKFDQKNLLEFLKSKNNYDVDRAIEICANDKCFNELVYLWGKIGETKKALSLIIDKQDNPKLAIQFVESSGDPELWEYLITYSMNKPAFIKELLDVRTSLGGGHADIVGRIPSDLQIDGLQASLESVVRENFLNLKVNSGVFKIIDDETQQFANEFLRLRETGRAFEIEN
ncbi:LANO_0F03268g1_1 [Lachancea nothofagi CBS 11611]|uniref:Vacuolar protein sorting-associated protein 41 n=1 Tax=Lachancea nothofagi CBS 11611 TaxID=1266666 RepID=A0A1G4K725_9SACH|nr:LANO_0F03268g1_1 [Lachancea nothofagi CBS 11611]